MFRFTRKPSSGSHSQYLAKITHSVQCGYIEVVQTKSLRPAFHSDSACKRSPENCMKLTSAECAVENS